jgi:hypothetical protein
MTELALFLLYITTKQEDMTWATPLVLSRYLVRELSMPPAVLVIWNLALILSKACLIIELEHTPAIAQQLVRQLRIEKVLFEKIIYAWVVTQCDLQTPKTLEQLMFVGKFVDIFN